MVTVKVDISKVAQKVESIFDKLRDKDYLLRPLAIETIPNMKERIHKEGNASDGNQIGTYSNGYMKLRTGNYGNAKEGKDSGAFTKGSKAFSDVKTKKANMRPNYKRSSDTKIVVSLTRQLENDWSVLGTATGYGIGFNNPLNAQKARWVEEGKRKIIFNTSSEERDYIRERVEELTNDAINS